MKRYTFNEFKKLYPNKNNSEILKLYQVELEKYRRQDLEIINQQRNYNLEQAKFLKSELSKILQPAAGYTPPIPPPPPVLPTGYSVWFDGSDTANMEFTSNTVSKWEDKTGNMEFGITQFGNSNNITQGSNAVRFAENSLSASISNGETVTYSTTGMTLFMVANIHSKDAINPLSFDVAHLYGRQLGVVGVSGTTIGQWAVNAASTDLSENNQFTPRLQVQVTSNGGQNFSGNSVDVGSLFLVEFQVSKSNGDAEINIITQQGSNSNVKHYGSSYSFINVIGTTNDNGNSGHLWDIGKVSSNPYTSDTSFFHIIHYPKLLTEEETQGVYDYINYYQNTNFQYTSSFIA